MRFLVGSLLMSMSMSMGIMALFRTRLDQEVRRGDGQTDGSEEPVDC